MTPAELSRIGDKLFGRYWTVHMAYTLGRSRYGIDRLKRGERKISPEFALIVRAMENGAIPARRDPDVKSKGRPRKAKA